MSDDLLTNDFPCDNIVLTKNERRTNMTAFVPETSEIIVLAVFLVLLEWMLIYYVSQKNKYEKRKK